MEFKVGDRVRALGEVAYTDLKGKTGTIRVVKDNGTYGIEFDEDIDGHSLDGKCHKDRGRYSGVGDKFEFVKKGIQKVPTHLVVWDEEDVDPHRFFTSEKEAKDFMKELSEKSDVVQDSVILVEIKSAQKVSITKIVRWKGYKI